MQCVRDMAVASQHIQLGSLRCLWFVFHSRHPRMPLSLKSNNKINKKIPRRGLFYCDPRLLKPFFFSNLAEHLQRLKALERIFLPIKNTRILSPVPPDCELARCIIRWMDHILICTIYQHMKKVKTKNKQTILLASSKKY